jgi:N-acetylglucosamine-6-phosphate deacetylase
MARAMIAGIHAEGPAIAPEDGPRGAHPAAHVRAPDLAEFARWQAASGGRVRMVTLSPHWPETAGFIAALVAQGVHVALGHTGASPACITAAVDAGARLSTHLGNGAAAMLPRHPNLIWAQLADDRLTATLIADGHHLPADTLRVFLRAKELARAVLVSDSAAPGGCAPGVYRSAIGAEAELSADGRLSMRGTPYLAGAARSLSENVAMAMAMAGLSLAEALALATRNPARFAGGGGVLEPGARADLIRFDHAPGDTRLTLREVWLAGERVTA